MPTRSIVFPEKLLIDIEARRGYEPLSHFVVRQTEKGMTIPDDKPSHGKRTPQKPTTRRRK